MKALGWNACTEPLIFRLHKLVSSQSLHESIFSMAPLKQNFNATGKLIDARWKIKFSSYRWIMELLPDISTTGRCWENGHEYLAFTEEPSSPNGSRKVYFWYSWSTRFLSRDKELYGNGESGRHSICAVHERWLQPRKLDGRRLKKLLKDRKILLE